MVEQRVGFGLSGVLVGILNSDGVLIGNDATGADAGDQDGQLMFRLRGAQTVPVQSPEPSFEQAEGDDEPLAQINFGPDGLENGQLLTGARDIRLEAKLNGTSLRSYGNLRFGSQNPSGATLADVCIIAQRRSKNLSDGVTKWEGSVIPSATLSPRGSQYNSRGIDAYAYSYAASKSRQYPWGVTFSTAVEGKEADSIIPFDTAHPFMIQTWQGNGSQTTFNFGVAPFGVTSTNLQIFVNKLPQDLGSAFASVSTTSFEFNTAPGDGLYIHAVYDVEDLFKKVTS